MVGVYSCLLCVKYPCVYRERAAGVVEVEICYKLVLRKYE